MKGRGNGYCRKPTAFALSNAAAVSVCMEAVHFFFHSLKTAVVLDLCICGV